MSPATVALGASELIEEVSTRRCSRASRPGSTSDDLALPGAEPGAFLGEALVAR